VAPCPKDGAPEALVFGAFVFYIKNLFTPHTNKLEFVGMNCGSYYSQEIPKATDIGD